MPPRKNSSIFMPPRFMPPLKFLCHIFMPPPNFENVNATFLYATLIIYVFQKETQIQKGILTILAHFFMTQKFFMIGLLCYHEKN